MNQQYTLILKKFTNNKSGLDGELLFNEKDSSLMMYNSFQNEWKIFKSIDSNKIIQNEIKISAPPIETYSLYPILQDPPKYESIFNVDEDSKYVNVRIKKEIVDDNIQDDIEDLNNKVTKKKKKLRFINNEYLHKLLPFLNHAYSTTNQDENIIIQKQKKII